MVQDEQLDLGELRLHFRDWPGPGADAPVLLLLHGLTGHARMWDSFARDLCKSYRVLTLDFRGHGESNWAAPDRYSLDILVEDLDRFTTALNLGSFSLVGLSLGGIISYHYAASRPTALERLVVVDIAPEIPAQTYRVMYEIMSQMPRFSSRVEAVERELECNPNSSRR